MLRTELRSPEALNSSRKFTKNSAPKNSTNPGNFPRGGNILRGGRLFGGNLRRMNEFSRLTVTRGLHLSKRKCTRSGVLRIWTPTENF